MNSSRRKFLSSGVALASTFALPSITPNCKQTKPKNAIIKDRFDPWIEVLPNAIKYNAKVLYRLSGNKPVLAVIKNNDWPDDTECHVHTEPVPGCTQVA